MTDVHLIGTHTCAVRLEGLSPFLMQRTPWPIFPLFQAFGWRNFVGRWLDSGVFGLTGNGASSFAGDYQARRR
jgi:hypothetical protein